MYILQSLLFAVCILGPVLIGNCRLWSPNSDRSWSTWSQHPWQMECKRCYTTSLPETAEYRRWWPVPFYPTKTLNKVLRPGRAAQQWLLSVVLVQTCASAVLVVPLGSRCWQELQYSLVCKRLQRASSHLEGTAVLCQVLNTGCLQQNRWRTISPWCCSWECWHQGPVQWDPVPRCPLGRLAHDEACPSLQASWRTGQKKKRPAVPFFRL